MDTTSWHAMILFNPNINEYFPTGPELTIRASGVFIENVLSKIRRGPKLEGCAFANFGNSSGTEEEPSQKREKNGGKIKE